MFDVGFSEILLIGIVALVVIGPERLPAVAKTAGQWIGKLQRFVKGVKTDLASELETGDLKKLIGDQREQIDELRNMVTSAKKDFQNTAQSVAKSTKDGLSDLETSVNEAKSEVAKLKEPDANDASADSSGAKAVTLDKSSADKAQSTEQAAPADSAPAKRTGTTDSDEQ